MKGSYIDKYGNAFFGSLGNGAVIKDVVFDKAEVVSPLTAEQNYQRGNVFGIVAAYASDDVTIENVTVKNSSVTGMGKVSPIIAMAATKNGTTTVKNCKVEDTTISAYYNAAGFIGLAQNKVVMSGNSVKGLNFTSAIPAGNYKGEYKTYNQTGDVYEATTVVNADNTKTVTKTPKNVTDTVKGYYWNDLCADGAIYAGCADFYNKYYSDTVELNYNGKVTCLLTTIDDKEVNVDAVMYDAVASVTSEDGSTETKYLTLPDAVAAAKTGDTVTLLDNAEGAGVKIEPNTKSITIDLNNKTYTFSNGTVGSTGTENQGLHFEKENNITIKNGTFNISNSLEKIRFIIQNYADLTLDNVILDGTNLNYPDKDLFAISSNCGEINIKGGSITVKSGDNAIDCTYWVPSYGKGTQITVDGTSIDGDVMVDIYGNIADTKTPKSTLTLKENVTLKGNIKTDLGTGNYGTGLTEDEAIKAFETMLSETKGYAVTKVNDKDGIVVKKVDEQANGTKVEAKEGATTAFTDAVKTEEGTTLRADTAAFTNFGNPYALRAEYDVTIGETTTKKHADFNLGSIEATSAVTLGIILYNIPEGVTVGAPTITLLK